MAVPAAGSALGTLIATLVVMVVGVLIGALQDVSTETFLTALGLLLVALATVAVEFRRSSATSLLLLDDDLEEPSGDAPTIDSPGAPYAAVARLDDRHERRP